MNTDPCLSVFICGHLPWNRYPRPAKPPRPFGGERGRLRRDTSDCVLEMSRLLLHAQMIAVDAVAYDRPTICSARSAARTPRYCASSKIEKPLRSEFAYSNRPVSDPQRLRSSDARNPGTGRAIACPTRSKSIRDTH